MKVIFLDRDGVINKDAPQGNYIKSWQEFQFLPSSIDAIRMLTENGYDIFIISNQAGVAKKLYTEKDLKRLTDNMIKEIEKAGGKVNKVTYCMHKNEDNCDCRKPKIGMFEKAAKGMNIDFKKTYYIGDAKRDIIAGKRVGCRTILLLTGKEKEEDIKNWEAKPDFIKNSLKEAVSWILKEEQK